MRLGAGGANPRPCGVVIAAAEGEQENTVQSTEPSAFGGSRGSIRGVSGFIKPPGYMLPVDQAIAFARLGRDALRTEETRHVAIGHHARCGLDCGLHGDGRTAQGQDRDPGDQCR